MTSDALADSTARLERLLERIMRETDPLKYAELGAQIWRVFDERDLLKSVLSLQKPATDKANTQEPALIRENRKSCDTLLRETPLRSRLKCFRALLPTT